MEMKKKVLFIVGTLQSGGVSKSMVSLLTVWDSTRYDTSLLLCSKKEDVFSKFIPEDVHIIYSPVIEHVMGGMESARWLLLHGHLLLTFGVLLRLLLSRISRSLAGELIARMMPVVSDEHYDLIVDYGGQQLLYYMVDKLSGTRKVSFFHSDYAKWPFYFSADKRYYLLVDHIFTISSICAVSLKRYFPACSQNISFMENISSPYVIRRQSLVIPSSLRIQIDRMKSDGNTILCTVGHICRAKGFDLAVRAAEYLKTNRVRFKWFFVGKVIEEDLPELIKEKGLDGYMMLVGVQSNPYPYIGLSDIVVHPSRFEGRSISLDEAKVLCKPIVVTDFSTVSDQFENRTNASICVMDGEEIGKAIIELLNNPDLQETYRKYLEAHITDNSSEVNKLYRNLQ